MQQKKMCESYIKKKMIEGCSKPFRVIDNNGKLETEICDYL
jgi:hypothetical protein